MEKDRAWNIGSLRLALMDDYGMLHGCKKAKLYIPPLLEYFLGVPGWGRGRLGVYSLAHTWIGVAKGAWGGGTEQGRI